jgi:protein-tyrosine phosphatase
MRGVLFVCTGNICRSPTADGVMRRLVREAGLAQAIRVDSAGTHDYHVGEPPDPRAQEHARRRGYDLSGLRARRIEAGDFDAFELILAMDRGHLAILRRMARQPQQQDKLHLLMEYALSRQLDEVPDPYYGGPGGFERVLDMVESAARGLLEHLRGGLQAP